MSLMRFKLQIEGFTFGSTAIKCSQADAEGSLIYAVIMVIQNKRESDFIKSVLCFLVMCLFLFYSRFVFETPDRDGYCSSCLSGI